MKHPGKRLITLFSTLLFFSISTSFAAHIAGGYITYECLGKNSTGQYEYDVTVHFFKDCEGSPQFPNGNTPFDASIRIRIYDARNSQFVAERVAELGDSVAVNIDIPTNCSPALAEICYAKAEYKIRISLPENEDGYHISWIRCCRAGNISNLDAPGGTGMVMRAFIPNTDFCNNSPQFVSEPSVILFKDENNTLDLSAIDIDGDSLVYEMIPATTGGDRLDPIPVPLPPPHFPATYLPGFGAQKPFGDASAFELDAMTGELTTIPQMEGIYAFAINVKEYRDGQLINETPREIQVNVIHRPSDNPCPDITSQDLVTYLPVYPNPFTVATTFHFHLKEGGKLNLEIFDSRGRKVAILINRQASPGYRELEWTPGKLASGIYYYRVFFNDELLFTDKMFYNHP
jgi:hypothetical protein